MYFFGKAIAESAPHIYVSALALAPTESEVKQRFSSKFRGLLSLVIGHKTKWPASREIQDYMLQARNRYTAQYGPVKHSPKIVCRLQTGPSLFGKDRPAPPYDEYMERVRERAKRELATTPLLEGHTMTVGPVAFSPNGNQIASGSWDKTVRIWNANTGAVFGTPMRGHTDWVDSVAFSPNGRYIVSGSKDQTVRIWDAKTTDQLSVIKGHTSWVHSVAFSPDGNRIIAGSYGDILMASWSGETGATVEAPLKGHQGSVTSVKFSPDGKHIVSGSSEKTVQIWHTDSKAAVGKPLEGHIESVTSVAFSPDGRYIVSASNDKTLRIWDAEIGHALGEPLTGQSDKIRCISVSPDCKHIVSVSGDVGSHGSLRIWNAKTGARVGELSQGLGREGAKSVTFSPDGKKIVSGSYDNSIRVWDTASVINIQACLPGFGDSYGAQLLKVCLSIKADVQ